MDELSLKQKSFNKAMDLYHSKTIYQKIPKVVSFINVGGQILLIILLITRSMSFLGYLVSFVIALVLADFWNGLVHMYMDNNDKYEGFFGPLIASFHLHHRTPSYKKKSVLLVYYGESGAKLWMAPLEIIILLFISKLPTFIGFTFLYFFLISSFAELSHYFCHTIDGKFINFLQKSKIILNKKHHAKHHLSDNQNYAFLNGISDPLLNIIAKKLYSGYKEGTDKHYEEYQGKETSNR